jgi:uncharacterized protein with GYD domain
MPTFISFVNWTDQGIKNVKDAPNRLEAARAALKGLGGEVKDVYVTNGQYDMVVIADAPDGDAMATFALAVGAQGNVRTETVRGFTEGEFQKIVSNLP